MKLDARPKTQDLGAFAFYQGAHGVPLNDTLQEIESAHQIERAKLEQDSVKQQKPLEAIIERLEQHRQHVDEAWKTIVRRLGCHIPPIASAIVIGVLGLAALVVDAILLGPGLDALGISDPVLQFASAFGLAALSATTFHLAYETFGQHRHSFEIVLARRILGGVAVVSLLAWGILRGYQVRFAADLASSPLGTFLSDHVMLASIFFAFVTLAAPIVGAATYHDAAPRIHDWLTWKRSKAAHGALHKDLGEACTRLDEERLTLNKAIVRLDAQEHNWKAIAAQYHRRGHDHGARQNPHWLVLLKATGWSLGGLVLGCILGTLLAPLYFAIPAGAWMAAFLYYRRARIHPTYDEFKRQENTQFTIRTERPRKSQSAAPSLPTPSEDPQ